MIEDPDEKPPSKFYPIMITILIILLVSFVGTAGIIIFQQNQFRQQWLAREQENIQKADERVKTVHYPALAEINATRFEAQTPAGQGTVGYTLNNPSSDIRTLLDQAHANGYERIITVKSSGNHDMFASKQQCINLLLSAQASGEHASCHIIPNTSNVTKHKSHITVWEDNTIVVTSPHEYSDK